MDAERMVLLLPDVYQRAAAPGTPLAALLTVMADQHAPVEQLIERLPGMLDPWRAPDAFVPFLARWLGLDGWLAPDGDFEAGVETLRAVVAAAPELRQSRGTKAGLARAVSLALGGVPVRVDDDPDRSPAPFRVRVTLPPGSGQALGMVQRIVREEKAAHCVVEVVVAPEPPPPEPAEGQ